MSPDRVLDVARSQLGVVEGPRSNQVVYNDWYYGKRVSGASYPWCGAFVSWVADRAGAGIIIPKGVYTPTMANWFKERGQWHDVYPKAGDVVFFKWPNMGRIAHVGFVEGVRQDGTVVSIEGNTDKAGGRTGGRVMRQVRRAYIAGFGRPDYASLPDLITEDDDVDEDLDLSNKSVARLLQICLKNEAIAANREGPGKTLELDGDWGPVSTAACAAYQAGRIKTSRPGVPGPHTAALLYRWEKR